MDDITKARLTKYREASEQAWGDAMRYYQIVAAAHQRGDAWRPQEFTNSIAEHGDAMASVHARRDGSPTIAVYSDGSSYPEPSDLNSTFQIAKRLSPGPSART